MAHKIRNRDHAMHGLWCSCIATPCVYANQHKEPCEATNLVDAYWLTLSHDERQRWRRLATDEFASVAEYAWHYSRPTS